MTTRSCTTLTVVSRGPREADIVVQKARTNSKTATGSRDPRIATARIPNAKAQNSRSLPALVVMAITAGVVSGDARRACKLHICGRFRCTDFGVTSCCDVADTPTPATCSDVDLCSIADEWCADANGDLPGGNKERQQALGSCLLTNAITF
jgi:hypothetical protein